MAHLSLTSFLPLNCTFCWVLSTICLKHSRASGLMLKCDPYPSTSNIVHTMGGISKEMNVRNYSKMLSVFNNYKKFRSAFQVFEIIDARGRHSWISKFVFLDSGICLRSPSIGGALGSASSSISQNFTTVCRIHYQALQRVENYRKKVRKWKKEGILKQIESEKHSRFQFSRIQLSP